LPVSDPVGYVLDAGTGRGALVPRRLARTYKTSRAQNAGGLFLAEFHAARAGTEAPTARA